MTAPDVDDLEPIVVLDDDASLAALSTVGVSDGLDGPRLLRDLTDYAQSRLVAGDATDALRVVEADVPDLVAGYQMGFLPLNYREALPPIARRMLTGRRIARSLWLPATDAQGVVVDALAIHARPQGGAYVEWCAQPKGLLGASIITSFSDLIVCDNLRVVAKCFQRGLRNTLLLRSVSDAHLNADRLIAAGVRRIELRVCRTITGYADVLRAAGLQVRVASHVLDAGAGYVVAVPAPLLLESEPESDPHAVEETMPSVRIPTDTVTTDTSAVLELVHHDRSQELATFRAGALTYVMEAPTNGRTVLDVTVRHGDQVQRDRFDLNVPAARDRFAGCAALRCGLSAPLIAGHLTELLHRVHDLAEADAVHTRSIPSGTVASDAAEVQEWLTAPDLLERIAADLDTLGWVGEDAAKRLAYLVSISRKLPMPLWCQRLVPLGIGTSGIDLIADLTPPEDVIRISRLTAALLNSQDPDSLRHALLVIDDSAAIADDAILALRILQTRGALAVTQPRHTGGVSSRSSLTEVRGPIALLTATSRRLDENLTAACLCVPLDESPAQTARVIATQGRTYAHRTGNAPDTVRQTIRARHHALHSALVRRPVVIACIERITFPAVSVQDRRDHAQFLGIVAAHALLHQHQRSSDGDAVVADERDVIAAITLAAAAGIGTVLPLSTSAADLLSACGRADLTDLTVHDVSDLFPTWTTYTTRAVIAELVAIGHLAVTTGGGQGRRVVYRLVSTTTQANTTRIRLVSAPTLAAEPFGSSERFSKGSTPDALCG